MKGHFVSQFYDRHQDFYFGNSTHKPIKINAKKFLSKQVAEMHVLKPTIDETGSMPSNCLIQFSLNRVLNNAIATFALCKG